MRALFLFHLGAGVRMAARSSAIVVAAIPALITLQEAPAAFIAGFANAAFRDRLVDAPVVPLVSLALLMPLWAAPRLSIGLNGWLRHLPVDRTLQRRGLAVALVTAQLPLFLMLVGLGVLAHARALPIVVPAARWALVLVAGAVVALPVERRMLVACLALTALALAVGGSKALLAVSALLLIAADAVAGRIRTTSRRPLRPAGVLLHWRIAWRSLGARLFRAYGAGLLALGAGWLAAVNNRLEGPTAAGVARCAGAVGIVLSLSSLAKTLALRRPMWPLARSLPWSSFDRVAGDAVFLAVHSLPLLLLVAVQNGRAALWVLPVVPFFAALAAGHMRRMPEHRGEALVLLAEGLLVAALLTLVPWSALIWLAGAIPALHLAAARDRGQKVTRWPDLLHDAAGDPVQSDR